MSAAGRSTTRARQAKLSPRQGRRTVFTASAGPRSTCSHSSSLPARAATVWGSGACATGSGSSAGSCSSLVFVSGLLPALLLIFLFAGGEYVGFVFSSAVPVVAVALAGAVALARLALVDTAERARGIGDATLLASLGRGRLPRAYLHALWVVYVLVLTSLWPLKVVTSK